MPVAAVLPILALSACFSDRAGPRDERLWPALLSDGLDVATPQQVGLDSASLASLLKTAGDDEHQELKSILIARKGRLVVEAYFNGATRETLHDVRSTGKSITSTLVGLAIQDGRITSLDQSISRFFPPAAASAVGASGVTVRRLLEMRSGIAVDDFDDSPNPYSEDLMDGSPDPLRFALAAPMAGAPGARWAYASMNTMILGRIVSAATGRDLEEYAKEKLFRPLGFGPYRWNRDRSGHIIGQGSLFVRARDILKFGLLFLQKGKWRGRQLVPEAWVAAATLARTTFPTIDPRNGLGELYKGYGYQWWTGSEAVGPTTVPFFFASGNGGQRVFVIPSLEMVLVTTSSGYQRGRAHRRAHAVLRQSLAAVKDGAPEITQLALAAGSCAPARTWWSWAREWEASPRRSRPPAVARR